MKKFFLLLFTYLFVSANLSALLPPLYEGIREITTILKDPQLNQLLLSSEIITRIERTQEGYLIATNHHELQVNVVYKHEGKIGPQQFLLIFRVPKEREAELPNFALLKK